MKRILTLLILIIGGLSASAQNVVPAPRQMSLQAVVRDARGNLLPYSELQLHIDIVSDTTGGSPLYTEEQTVSTNSFGSFSTLVGTGSIDWGEGPYFMHIAVTHPDGLELETTYQLVSVPYALNVHVTDSLRGVSFREKQRLSMGHDTIYLTGGSFVRLPARFDGDYNSLRNRPTGNRTFANDAGYLTNEVQVLSIRHDTVFLTGGSYVVLPAGFDGDYNHLTNKPTALSQFTNNAGFLLTEQQVLSVGHDTVFLTGGSYVKIPRRAEVQNLDSVTVLGNRAGNRQLKNLADPTDPQDVLTNHYLDSLLALLNLDSATRGTRNVIVREVCDGHNWHGTWVTESGDYPYSYSNDHGFFCIDTLRLTVRHGSHSTLTIATNDTYTWHGTPYTQSGVYTYNYTNSDGCPSVDTLVLTIAQQLDCTTIREASDTLTLEACGVTVWYGRYFRLSGIYEQDLGYISTDGCDSIVRVNLIIHERYQNDTVVRSSSPVVWRGHTYSTQGDYYDTVSHPGQCDSLYVLHLSMNNKAGIGAVPGLFSLADGLTVRFAKGNLQFYADQDYWRFAPEQYEYNNSPCHYAHYAAWADIFGWATSGYHNIADPLCTHYQPWALSNVTAPEGTEAYNYNLYGYGPSLNMTDADLVGTSLLYDWGQFNQISNGGNEDSLWRLPTRQEWEYLLNGRPNAASLRFLGFIDSLPNRLGDRYSEFANVLGLFIMADDWSCPANFYYNPASTSAYDNVVHPTQWRSLEASGMVFLPISYLSDEIRFYWSSTSGSAGGAYALSIGANSFVVGPYNRSNGYSVRLVQNAVNGAATCACTTFDTVIVANGPLTWNGNTYTHSGEYVEVLTNSQGCDSIITLSLLIVEPGVLAGRFSVSDTHQVCFSKGNLQYHPKDNVWRFALTQYDFKGTENDHLTADFCGWVDLFPWATSGYHNPTDVRNTQYHPWDCGDASYYGPSANMADWNLINTSAQYDWGVHNPIANGGNTAGLWRTLSFDEWNYLIYQRSRADSLRGLASIDGSQGFVLLPDNWDYNTAPYAFKPNEYVENPRVAFDSNSFTLPEWSQMEAAGAVFLPAAGVQYVFNKGANYRWMGYYWSSTSLTQGYDEAWTSQARMFAFGYDGYSLYIAPAMGDYSKNHKMSVRLVKD